MTRAGAAVCLAALALITATPSQAATTIGEIDQNSAVGINCDAGKVYLQGKEKSVSFTVPAGGGVITAWATKPGTGPAMTQRAALKVLRRGAGDSFTVLSTTALEALTDNVVSSFRTRLSVSGGEQIAYSFPPGGPAQQRCARNTDGMGAGFGEDLWHGPITPPTADAGTTFTVTDKPGGFRLNLTATIEADADRDGFGDETQDRCLGVAGPNNGCPTPLLTPPADTTKPTLGNLTFSRTAFAAARSGAAFSAAKKKRRKPPVGTKVSFTLSEAAAVKFTVQRKATGRRVAGKCKGRTRRNRKKPRCTLWKPVAGSFTYPGKPGTDRFTFRGRIGGKALKTGSYRLVDTATDAAKNASAPKNKQFRIVK